MGICQSTSEEEKARRRQNAAINEALEVDRRRQNREVKILLLGAGESGKSTILKQMRLIHGVGFSLAEREAFRPIIWENLVAGVLRMVEETGYAAESESVRQLRDAAHYERMPAAVRDAVLTICSNKRVESCVVSKHRNDTIGYFYRRREAVLAPGWVPTDEDMLHARAKTTGISETAFTIGGTTYRMFDVGGQRSERKKWIHCFENVTAILFLAALSEYDERLVEDEAVNRMQEALTLFDSIANSRWFKRRTAIILFLNKIDIFRDKIETVPVEDYFPDYAGGDDYESATAYFEERFRSVLQDQERRPMYTHLTCATDTQQIRFVMQAVRDIIRKESLRASEIE